MLRPDDRADEQASWISPWGAAAFAVATLALLQASVLGLRWLTVGLAALGLLLLGQGIRATRNDRQSRDRVWFTVGGGLSGVVLLAALIVPGLLNSRWAIDSAVPQTDPDAQMLVPRARPLDEGRRLAAEDWAEAETEAIRQGDLIVRVESVEVGPLPEKADVPYLLVHLRLANCKHGTIAAEGFGNDKQPPVLTDDAGGSYPFLEGRPRRPASGAPVFAVSAPQGATLGPLERQDYLLVFAAPPSPLPALKLEVPASAWGRNGACKIRISRLFDASVPRTP
jgi:hypothetical protein